MLNTLDLQAASIAAKNDCFRESGLGILLSQGARTLRNLEGLLGRIKMFNDFNEDNDPFGEHDSGSLKWEDEKVFWKIDYYDKDLENWVDPLVPECKRQMTVMLADEY